MDDGLLRNIGLLITFGTVLGAWSRRLGVPRVTGYLLAGFLFSPDLLGGALGFTGGVWTERLTTACLGVIAYLVGGSITISQLRKHGSLIAYSAIGESLGAVTAVVLGLSVLRGLMDCAPDPLLVLGLGIMAATTAPAATLAIMHQYRVRGPLGPRVIHRGDDVDNFAS